MLKRMTAVLMLTAGMCVVPTVGTRGQGTLGDRVVHVDREIMGSDARAQLSLAKADAMAAKAVSGL